MFLPMWQIESHFKGMADVDCQLWQVEWPYCEMADVVATVTDGIMAFLLPYWQEHLTTIHQGLQYP